MKELKVGDWIRITEPAGNFLEKISKINSQTYTLSGTNICYKSQAKPWTPESGEWCWVFNDDRIPTISQFVEINEDMTRKYFAVYPNKPHALGSWYKYCEPFIGELPSNLKDL